MKVFIEGLVWVKNSSIYYLPSQVQSGEMKIYFSVTFKVFADLALCAVVSGLEEGPP